VVTLIERGQHVDGLEIRATVPVNMRPEHKMDSLGNYFGLVFLSLPIGIENPSSVFTKSRNAWAS
jgi:diacylglycerol O-acyltransferase